MSNRDLKSIDPALFGSFTITSVVRQQIGKALNELMPSEKYMRRSERSEVKKLIAAGDLMHDEIVRKSALKLIKVMTDEMIAPKWKELVDRIELLEKILQMVQHDSPEMIKSDINALKKLNHELKANLRKHVETCEKQHEKPQEKEDKDKDNRKNPKDAEKNEQNDEPIENDKDGAAGLWLRQLRKATPLN